MIKFVLSPVKNNETKKFLKQLGSRKAKNLGYVNKMYYLDNTVMLKSLKVSIDSAVISRQKVVLELHADGMPLEMMNGEEYGYTPFEIAKILESLKLDDSITIDLRFCNSGTVAVTGEQNICYAEQLSKALSYLQSYPQVHGYAAYIHSENNLKQSCVSEHDIHGAKVSHCRLEDARCIYARGQLIQAPNKCLVEYDFIDSDDLNNYNRTQNEFYTSVSDRDVKRFKEEEGQRDLLDSRNCNAILNQFELREISVALSSKCTILPNTLDEMTKPKL